VKATRRTVFAAQAAPDGCTLVMGHSAAPGGDPHRAGIRRRLPREAGRPERWQRRRRRAGAPELPTIAESGWPDFAFEIWHVIAARAGTPAPVLARLQEAVSATLTDPGVMERITALGVDATPTVGEAAQARVTRELAAWVPMIRAAGIVAE
jgi:hypothetical protein